MSCFPSTVKGGEAWLGQFPGANVVQLKAAVQVFYRETSTASTQTLYSLNG